MPSITSITPSTFDAGRSVTLTGSGFGSSQGSVLIGGVAQNVNTWSDDEITFTTARGSQSLGACRVDVVPSSNYSWAFEGLETGLTGMTNDPDNGTVEWNAGGFARITYTAAGTTSLNYVIPTASQGAQILVQFDIRRHSTSCSKILKIPSVGLIQSPYNKYSNVTALSGGYSSQKISITGYSSDSNGGDAELKVDMDGTVSGTYRRSAPTFTVSQPSDVNFDVTGTVWHTMKFWAKFNSNNTADGEFAVWKDGVLLLHMQNVWNCATTDGDGVNPGVAEADLPLYRNRARVWLGNYTQSPAIFSFYEDYRNLKIGYVRPTELGV